MTQPLHAEEKFAIVSSNSVSQWQQVTHLCTQCLYTRSSLRNIATGVIAYIPTNAYEVMDVGNKKFTFKLNEHIPFCEPFDIGVNTDPCCTPLKTEISPSSTTRCVLI